MKIIGIDISAKGPAFSGQIALMYADTIREHAKSGQMVPIVEDGDVVCWVNRRKVGFHPVPPRISAEDFIVGLEMMGHRFEVMVGTSGDLMLLRSEPEFGEPPAWRDRANAIMAAFDRARTPELIEYVQAREVRA